MLTLALLAIGVFVLAATLDYMDVSCTLAVTERRARAAALWSVCQYAVGAVGFVVVVKISLWLMVPEGLGLYAGTRLALAKA